MLKVNSIVNGWDSRTDKRTTYQVINLSRYNTLRVIALDNEKAKSPLVSHISRFSLATPVEIAKLKCEGLLK